MKTPRRNSLALLLALVLLAATVLLDPARAPADEEEGQGDGEWRQIHAKSVAEARSRLEAERTALEASMDVSWADLSAKVSRREQASAAARAGIETRLAEARAGSERAARVLELAAREVDRAAELFARTRDLEFRVNRLKGDIQFLESYVPVVRKRIAELVDPEEKAALEASLVKDMLLPLERRRGELVECEGEWKIVRAAREEYEAFYAGRAETWKERAEEAEAAVLRLQEELGRAQEAIDRDPELAITEAQAGWWERGSELRRLLVARPVVDPAAVESGCLLCHFTPGREYFERSRLAYDDHPAVAGGAAGPCALCHDGDERGLTVEAAAHGSMVPRALLAAALALPEDGPSRYAAGEALWSRYRCGACHALDGEDPIRRKGSRLDGMNGWADYGWTVRWLVDPEPYSPGGAMPRYGLAQAEAQRIALYLFQFSREELERPPAPREPEEDEPHEEHGHAHEHEGGPAARIGATISAYDVKRGAVLFHEAGCLGCHVVSGRTEPMGVTEGLLEEERRLAGPHPAEEPYLEAGRVIDQEVLTALAGEGVRTIEVVNEAPLTLDLVDQRARLAEGYPARSPVYPAGTVIDREVYDFLRAERVRRVRLSGRGDDFGPELTFAGDKFVLERLAHWIGDPRLHDSGAAMPAFRFTPEEAWRVAIYLGERHAPGPARPVRRGLWAEVGERSSSGLRFALSASTPVLAAGPEISFELEIGFEGLEERLGPGELSRVSATFSGGGEGVGLELLPFADRERKVYQFFYRFPREGRYQLRIEAVASAGTPPIEVVSELDVRPFEASLEAEGRRLARDLSCAACHEIPGLETPERRDLSGLVREKRGSLPASSFAEWLAPAIARHRLPGGEVDSYRLGEEASREIAAYVLERVRAADRRLAPSARELVAIRAERILERHHCRGCHRLGPERSGGTFGPDLRFAGLKFPGNVLDRYLASPLEVRPEEGTPTMPSFALTGDERRDLVLWFESEARKDGVADLVREAAGAPAGDPERGRELVEEYRCRTCHLIGREKKYADDFADYRRADLAMFRKRAPRLVDLARRLDRAWMAAWIKDPRRFVPDTPMPDRDMSLEDAVSIRDYLLGLASAKDDPKPEEGSERR